MFGPLRSVPESEVARLQSEAEGCENETGRSQGSVEGVIRWCMVSRTQNVIYISSDASFCTPCPPQVSAEPGRHELSPRGELAHAVRARVQGLRVHGPVRPSACAMLRIRENRSVHEIMMSAKDREADASIVFLKFSNFESLSSHFRAAQTFIYMSPQRDPRRTLGNDTPHGDGPTSRGSTSRGPRTSRDPDGRSVYM